MDRLTIVRKPTSYGYVNEYEVLETGETFSSLTQNIGSAYADYVKTFEFQYNMSLWLENQSQPEHEAPMEVTESVWLENQTQPENDEPMEITVTESKPSISPRQENLEKLLIDAFADPLSYEICKLTQENCNGCIIDHPSQRQHDCLMLDSRTMMVWYLEQALERMDPEKAMKSFIELTNEQSPMNALELLRYDCKDSRSEIFSRRKEELEEKVIKHLN